LTSTSSRVRLFVALELPGAVRQALLGWRGPLLEQHPGLRAVAPESLHVTLCFLGSQGVDEVDGIAAVVARSGRGERIRLRVSEGIWLPRRRPRVLAVSLEDEGGALGRIQESLSGKLAGGGWYEREARPFLPHVTVARVRTHERVRPGELPPLDAFEFPGSRVTLFRSLTGRGGARYESLASIQV
jgi:RNA 2',3'-cyclic 3'-phosphodiesterase